MGPVRHLEALQKGWEVLTRDAVVLAAAAGASREQLQVRNAQACSGGATSCLGHACNMLRPGSSLGRACKPTWPLLPGACSQGGDVGCSPMGLIDGHAVVSSSDVVRRSRELPRQEHVSCYAGERGQLPWNFHYKMD